MALADAVLSLTLLSLEQNERQVLLTETWHEPPATSLSSLSHRCCPAARPVCTWSAPGSRMHVIKEGNSLYSSRWYPLGFSMSLIASKVLLHSELKGCPFPMESSRHHPLGEELQTFYQHLLYQALHHALIISSCTLPSSVLCAQTSLQSQKGQEQGYMHSGYVQQ